ncbi:hypothetical protein [Arthrobacter sp. UYCo732]|uniref:hypothetical protein n=1 Tax=Arthrobacter sp. UYCo732 TaxID=3156336 RepID=UPI0033915C9D
MPWHRDGVFVPTPRQRELGYWLSEEAGHYAPEGVTTALRAMAWNRGHLRGLAGAAVGAGVSFTGFGALGLASGGGPGVLFGLAAPGLSLVLFGVLMFRWIRKRLPKIADMAPSRGAGNFRSGLGAAAFFTLIFCGITYPLTSALLTDAPGGGVLLIGYALMTPLFFGSVFAVPAYFIEHAARDFRADIASSPGLRHSLEEMSLVWQDPVGAKEFGPL